MPDAYLSEYITLLKYKCKWQLFIQLVSVLFKNLIGDFKIVMFYNYQMLF